MLNRNQSNHRFGAGVASALVVSIVIIVASLVHAAIQASASL